MLGAYGYRRCAMISFVITLIVSSAVFLTFGAAFATTGPENGNSNFGISAVIVPAEARPGDIVELRVEMSRTSWGRFHLQLPNHPQLRLLAEEKIPIFYAQGIFRQQQTLLLQPVSSGKIVIAGMTATISTADGNQTIELPDLTLNVQAFQDVTLSNAPLPMPPDELETPTSVLPWCFGLAIGAVVVSLLRLFGFLRVRKRASQPEQSVQDSSRRSRLVDQLRSGIIFSKHDMEQLLNDPNISVSPELRSKIQQAVYSAPSAQNMPAGLARLLQEELSA